MPTSFTRCSHGLLRWLATGVLLWGLLLAGCGDGEPIEPNGRRVVIGVVLPVDPGDAFKEQRAELGLTSEHRHAQLLDDGTKIKLRIERVADRPEPGVAALRRLAARREVIAVVGFLQSDAMLAMAAEADSQQLPLLVATATNPDILAGRRYVSRLIFDDHFQAAVAALYARDERLLARAAVFRDTRKSYSRYLATEFARKFEAVGGQVSAVQDVAPGQRGFRAQLERIRKASPDLLYLPLSPRQNLAIVRALRKMAWRPVVMVPEGVLSTVLASEGLLDREFDGVIGTDVFSPNLPRSSLGRRYVLSQQEIAEHLDTYVVLGIESVLVLRGAMNRCLGRGLDRECLRLSIRQTRGLEGLVGAIDIEAEGRAFRPIVVNTVVHGKLKFLVRVH